MTAQQQPAPAPRVKGWCPGAHRPMMSGDGLLFRVRPFFGELSREQAFGLCDLAERFGNGMLDLTSRANLQIRGVAEVNQTALLEALDRLGVIDADPAVEKCRNILMPPDWSAGDATHALYCRVLETLPSLPDLPGKFGVTIDTASQPCLREGSADFRFEHSTSGALILRADGAPRGRAVTDDTAMDALRDMAQWFIGSGGFSAGRMARHLANCSLPTGWADVSPRSQVTTPQVGAAPGGTILGAPFGKIVCTDLRALLQNSQAMHLRPMLGRKLMVCDAQVTEAAGFVTTPSRLMDVHACPGAPYCPAASVKTAQLARALAPVTNGSLHVSGCEKGCAFPRAAATTFVGRGGTFDLVSEGQPWDEPCQRGLSPDTLMTMGERG